MSRSILIVEDEGVVALELEECLTQMGYRVPGLASTGDEAVRKAIELSPDLVLMDIRLKGDIDGIEAARQIVESQGIPVVYLTAYSDDSTLERAKKTAPFGYVLKPWEEKSLQIAIDMALHKAELEFEMRDQRDWYFSVLRYMGAPMIVCNVDGTVRFINASAQQLLAIEFSPDAPAPLSEVLEMRERPGGPRFGLSFSSRALKESPIQARHVVFVGHGGIELPVDLTVTPIKGENGSNLGFVLFLRPVSAPGEGDWRQKPTRVEFQEYLQTELIRVLILQEQSGAATDRFIEGQLDAYRRLMRLLGAPAGSTIESDWRNNLIRLAVRDAHEQTRRILLGHGDIAGSGRVPQEKFRKYLDVMTRRLVESTEPGSAPLSVKVAVDAGDVELDLSIYGVLMVNEIVQEAISSGVRGTIAVKVGKEARDDLRLEVRHPAPGSGKAPQATAVLNVLVAEVHGSFLLQQSDGVVWSVAYPNAPQK